MREILTQHVPGLDAPLWSVLLSYLVIPVLNELIQRAPIKAQSLLQLILGAIGRIVPKKAPPAVALLLATAATACSPMPTMLRATATAAVVTSTGYRGLDAMDATKEGQCQAYALVARDAAAARLCTADWRPKYVKARIALDAASATVESAMAAVPVVDLATNKERRKQTTEWTTTLGKLVIDLVKTLGEVGVKVPVLPGGP